MPYFYLQVDRLDEETAFPMYLPLGQNKMYLHKKVARRLDIYRRKGFRIIHFIHRPGYIRATRADGVKLELIVIERPTPLATNFCTGIEDDNDGDTVLH